MNRSLATSLALRHDPVAVILSTEKPTEALQGKEGVWSCVIPLFLAALKGKTAVFERKTTSCNGAKSGLGFGQFPNYPDGIEYFLSCGKPGLFEGEGYKKTPARGKEFVESLPIADIPYPYVIFKPLSQVDFATETPQLILLYVNADQLSALTVLANYDRPGIENVVMPFASGCQSLFLLPYAESQNEFPRAVVGLTDITVRPMVDPAMLSFAVPYSMFREMERNIQDSFLEKKVWQRVQTRLASPPSSS